MPRTPKSRPSQSGSSKPQSSKSRPAKPRGSQTGSSESSTTKRLNQLLASAGFGSRRHCEDLIREGRVLIDGEVVTELGVTLDWKLHKISVDGVPLKPQKLVYYAVHKPKGVVSTNSDPQGRPRVIDLVPPTERVFPVGRLDRNSDGLILLTNDGDLAQQLAHPKFGVTKIYRVTVAGEVKSETMKKMRQGIYIAEGLVQVDGAKILKARSKATDMEIRLREGKNREIRRILAKFGHKVQTLRRIAIGPLKLGDVPAGAYRKLTKTEIDKLRAIAHQAATAPPETFESPRPNKTSKKSPVKRQGESARPRGSGSRPPVDKNRRPAKQGPRSQTPPQAPSRVGSVIVGDDYISVEPKRSAKKTSKKRATASGVPTRGKSVKKSLNKRSSTRDDGPRASGSRGGNSSGGRSSDRSNASSSAPRKRKGKR